MTQTSIENLFQSIDTIVNARIANLPFDQTIECEIVNLNSAEENKYLIKYQASTFYAYSQGPTYSPGDIVYVQVPQGDFTQDKFILSKRSIVEKNSSKKMPFLSFVKYLNLFNAGISEAEYYIQIGSDDHETSVKIKPLTSFYDEGHLIAGYTRIGLKFAMKTSILEDLKSGTYGAKLILQGYDQSKTYLSGEMAVQEGSSTLETREFDFPMTEMIGSSIYNTLGYSNQEKVFDITNFVISSAQVVFYQKGNFRLLDDTAPKKYRIYFTNVQLYLGYDISEFINNNFKTFLYTIDGFYYNNDYFTKKLKIRFVSVNNSKSNLDIMNNVIIDSSIYDIHWEEHDASSPNKGPYSGYQSYVSLNRHSIQQDYNLSTERSRLVQGLAAIVENTTNGNRYVSNKLIFTSSAYLESSELLETLANSEYFSIDKNGYVFLNGGINGNTASGGVNIKNAYITDSTLRNVTISGGNLYSNLNRIKTAIEALGGSYTIV